MKKVLCALSIIVLVGLQALAQTTDVTGTVTDSADGNPIPGVSVFVKGTTIGTVTRPDGTFILSVPNDTETLVFSFVGMTTQEVAYTGQSTVNVALQSDAVDVGEVVVVAYGTAKKESLTGSAAVIDQKKIESRSVSSVAQILTGSTTGVQTTAGSGQPGSSPAIRIRGVGTLNTSADPLIVLDGAQYEGNMSSINPSDIASMTVLKDASSTALYGSRAANGVIIITTKKGKKGKENLVVNVKAQGGVIDQALPFYEEVNAQQYYELQAEAYAQSRFNSGSSDNINDARAYAYENIYSQLAYNPFVGIANDQIVGSDGKINPNAKVGFPDMDWYDAAKQTGYRQNYDVSLSGGSEKVSYFYSASYLDERGYVVRSDYERFNSRLNIDFQVKDWLSIGSNISVVLIDSDVGTTESATYSNPFRNARLTAPIYPIYLVDQATGEYILDGAGKRQYDDGGLYSRPINTGRNTIAELEWNSDEFKRNNIGNRSYAKFTIMDGLTATMNVGFDIQNYNYKGFENEDIGDGAPAGGRMDVTRYRRTTWNLNQLINYNKTLNKVHNIGVLLGHESYKKEYSYQSGFKNRSIVRGIYELNNFVNTSDNDSYTNDKTVEGYLAQLKYNYDNKYYIEGSFRRDGSSTFHRDVRWGNFYSLGGSWRLGQEAFLQEVSWIDNLKLRASYGEVGNDNIGDYGYQALYEAYPNAGHPGVRWSTVGNTDLTWEVNRTFDVALDFALFNRMSGSIEWYNRKSDDLLYDMPLPLSMGLLEQARNIADMKNTGLEINIQGDIVRNSEFRWNLNLMASTNKNEITSIPEPKIEGTKRWDEGRSIYDFYMRKYYDVDPADGATRFHVWENVTNDDGEITGTQLAYDDNGEPVLTKDHNAAGFGYVGADAFPDIQGSIGNTLTYKGFTLSALFTYSLGGKMYDNIYRGMLNAAQGESLHPDARKSWMNPGDVTDFPRLQYANTSLYATSDYFLISSDYFNIRNVTLNYDFPKSMISNWGLGQLSVFVTGENLHVFTARKGMNPMFNFSGTQDVFAYSPSKSIIFGFNLQF